MYNYFCLVTFTLNTSGGADVVSEKLTKEVDGVVVPCDRAESELRLHDKISKVGGNKATQSIKCVLLNPDGSECLIDEVIKSQPQTTEKKVTTDDVVAKLIADGKLSQSDIDTAKASLEEKAE